MTATQYKMPTARLGECLWFHTPGEEAMPATITQVGGRSVMVSIHAPDNRGHLVRDGVRHVNDPELASMPAHDSGCWDYTAYQRDVLALKDRFSELEIQLK